MRCCSIVVPVYNRASLTHQCLETLLAEPPETTGVEVIVVDDGSTDATPKLLAGYGDRIRVVTHATNSGFAAACNDGAAVASGEYLVFLNNDTIPWRGWLDALVRYADVHPQAAVVGSKLLFPNDTIQHAGVVIGEDRIPRHVYAGFPGDHPAVNKSRRFQIVTAGCALMRRDLFERAGGFDTAFRNGFEDVDLCLRLGEQGHEVHYCHESVLYHLESISREGRSTEDLGNFELYRSRWAHRVQPDDVRYYLEDGLLAIRYSQRYPVQLEASPLLAEVDEGEQARQAGWLLNVRARQVFDLMRENVHLSVRLRDAELARGDGDASGGARGAPARAKVRRHEPRLLCSGEVHWLSNEPSGRLISVIVPVKNGGPLLRELLPRIVGQRTRDSVEIIAVDSGSTDESVEVLREFRATVVAIDPGGFNHGSTRSLAARYANGGVFVFVNQSTLPADEWWLARLVAPLGRDSRIAGVCSRVLPRKEADLLAHRDGIHDPNASPDRQVRAITDWSAYRALSPHERRLLINFHSMSAAIRSDVFARIPFRTITAIGEDLLWAKEVLEAGFKIQHEPTSVVFHSHNYSYAQIFQRNFDDGVANREIVRRELAAGDVVPLITSLVRDDWRYLEEECGLDARELEHWRLAAVLRRTAQIIGQWVGLNQDLLPGDLWSLCSLTTRIKAGRTAGVPGG